MQFAFSLRGKYYPEAPTDVNSGPSDQNWVICPLLSGPLPISGKGHDAMIEFCCPLGIAGIHPKV